MKTTKSNKREKKGAFTGTRRSVYMVPPEDLVVIGVDDGDENHPLYDARVLLPIDENIVQGILLHGVGRPIDVIKDGPRYIVETGRTRVLHSREANRRIKERGLKRPLVQVPVMPPHAMHDRENLERMVIENEHRREDSIMNRAFKMERYMAFGPSEKEVAITFCCSVKTVRDNMKLLHLDKAVQKAVDQNKISASAAAEWSEMSREEQREQLKKALESGTTLTAKQTRAIANESKQKTGDKPKLVVPPKKVLRTIADRVAKAPSYEVDLAVDVDNAEALAALRYGFEQGLRVALGDSTREKLPEALALYFEDEEDADAPDSSEPSEPSASDPPASSGGGIDVDEDNDANPFHLKLQEAQADS